MIGFWIKTVCWVLLVPMGIGVIVGRIKKNNWLGLAIGILAIIACSSPCWTLKLYKWVDSPKHEVLRQTIWKIVIPVFLLVIIFICPFIQTLFMKNEFRKTKLIIKRILLNFIGIIAVFSYSLYISIRVSAHSQNISTRAEIIKWIDEILFKKNRSLSELITTVLAGNSEAAEVLLLFFLVLISGYIIYHSINKFNFLPKVFVLMGAWFFVVFINERVIQPLWFPGREIVMHDIANNMVGVLVGSILSIKSFNFKVIP